MGRKKKSGLDVCPLDVNVLSDIRMRRLIRLHQGDAIAVYMAVLCLIYRDGYYVEFNEDVCFFLSEQVGIREESVRTIIDDAVACGLFDCDVYESSNVLTSQDIQETYLEERRMVTKRRVVLERFVVLSEEMPQNSDKVLQNRDNAVKTSQNRDTSENSPQNASKCAESTAKNGSEPILSTPIAYPSKVITPAVDVVEDSYSTLELFNNSNSSNNTNQEKEKIQKKEKESVLVLPYRSAEFVDTWEILRAQPKWKKKSNSALQMSLSKLGKYPEEFAIHLMENAIAGGWQGVVFTWTPDDFLKWQSRKNVVPLPMGNKKPKDIYESNMESMNEAFRLIDEQYGT